MLWTSSHMKDTARNISEDELSGQVNPNTATCLPGHFKCQADVQEAGWGGVSHEGLSRADT